MRVASDGLGSVWPGWAGHGMPGLGKARHGLGDAGDHTPAVSSRTGPR